MGKILVATMMLALVPSVTDARVVRLRIERREPILTIPDRVHPVVLPS